MPVRDPLRHGVRDPHLEQEHMLGGATAADGTALARKRKEVFLFAVFVLALHPGKTVFKNPAFQVFFNLFIDDRPKKAVFSLIFLVVHSLEIRVSFIENAVYWAFSGLALTVGIHYLYRQ